MGQVCGYDCPDHSTGRYEVKRVLIVIILLMLAAKVHAGQIVDHVYAGTNGVWLSGPATTIPSCVEVGGAASVSVSPHISGVGQVFAGLSQTYVRWAGGVRYTVTDVLDPNFNTFLGIRYRGSSVSSIGISEWAPDAGFGWRPFPGGNMARLLIVGDSGYGLTSNDVLLTLGLRLEVPLR